MNRKDSGATSDEGPTATADASRRQLAQRHYEPDDQGELTTAIVFAIAEAQGVAPTEVQSPPLYDFIDVPAIENAFFGPDVAGVSRRGVGTVEFRYTDYLVKVQSDGWVRVFEPGETGA
jgi:hypothetical protein